MTKIKVVIAGVEYEYQGVTDLELIPLANIFGAESPSEGSDEYEAWRTQFNYRFADYASQRILGHFLRCAFPDIPDSVVKYQVRRLPDGTEICDPGRDLRVKLSSWELERIIKAISPELKQIQQAQVEQANLNTRKTDGASDALVENVPDLDDTSPTDEEIEEMQRALALLAKARRGGGKGFSKQTVNK